MKVKPRKTERFAITEKQSLGFGGNTMVLVDTTTGVQYLFVASGYAGGLTPLLDSSGRPVTGMPYPMD